MNKMKKYFLAAALALLSTLPAAAQRGPQVKVDVPQEIFTQSRQKPLSCQRCCIYDNSSYSEGAIINIEGNLLQCQREAGTTGTNPLIWQRITP